MLKGWEWSRVGEAHFRQEEEHTQRACGRKECWASEGQEGGPGDCSVMSEGKKRLEMLAGASPGSTHRSMSAVDFLLPAVGSHGIFDRGDPTIRVML